MQQISMFKIYFSWHSNVSAKVSRDELAEDRLQMAATLQETYWGSRNDHVSIV